MPNGIPLVEILDQHGSATSFKQQDKAMVHAGRYLMIPFPFRESGKIKVCIMEKIGKTRWMGNGRSMS